MSRPPYEYTAYGLHVRSPFALPFTPPPGGPRGECGSHGERGPQGGPDVRIRIGTTPTALPAPADRPGVWESAPGAFLLDVPGVVRYLATDGRDVLVEPHGGGGAGGRPVVLPAFPGLRLWADALDKLAWPRADAGTDAPGT